MEAEGGIEPPSTALQAAIRPFYSMRYLYVLHILTHFQTTRKSPLHNFSVFPALALGCTIHTNECEKDNGKKAVNTTSMETNC